MPVSFVSSLLCTLKSFLIVQASPFSNPVSNFLNCLLSFRDRSVCSIPNFQRMIQPCKISIGTVAPELRQ